MNDLSGALCRGKSWLFDSTAIADHRAARELCRQCPALAACDTLRIEASRVSKTVRLAGGGPVGTWAGRLLTSKGVR